jgi:hypothetical protein
MVEGVEEVDANDSVLPLPLPNTFQNLDTRGGNEWPFGVLMVQRGVVEEAAESTEPECRWSP